VVSTNTRSLPAPAVSVVGPVSVLSTLTTSSPAPRAAVIVSKPP
jgi:hypothetical protein